MATTTHIGMTLVEQSQSQKEITVNQALTRIDALMNTGAKKSHDQYPTGFTSQWRCIYYSRQPYRRMGRAGWENRLL